MSSALLVVTLALLAAAACLPGAALAQSTTTAVTYTGSGALKFPTFYDALAADKANHALVLSAAAANPAVMALLKSKMNVTAFVPTDTAFVVAALKYKMGTDPTKVASDSCLILGLLNYHTIKGPGMKVPKLSTITKRATMLNSTMATATGAAEPYRLLFRPESGSVRVVGGATNGLVKGVMNVGIQGGGFLHNIDTVLLPTTDMTAARSIFGCS